MNIRTVFKRAVVLVGMSVLAAACTGDPVTPEEPGGTHPGDDREPPAGLTGDVTVNWLPYSANVPQYYWDAYGVLYLGDRNNLGMHDVTKGLQHHLLLQSVAGLTHRALKEGDAKVGVWMGAAHEEYGNYHSRQALHDMGAQNLGVTDGYQLATKTFADVGGVEVNLRERFEGYVLTDVENNPESNIVASVAAHVHNSIIVDVRDKTLFDAAGYKMTYDARYKTTRDSWSEFRNWCDNRALVLMPVQTGELRELAIANRLFVINLNHFYNDSSRGDNFETFAEVLAWLAPNAPVYGWDQGIDENRIAETISKYGKHSVPYDWGYNTSMTSVNYAARQDFPNAKTLNPKEIDYTLDKRFVSFYLTDGDNVQWMMGGFDRWYDHPKSNEVGMTYGIAVANTAMIGPAQLKVLFGKQPANVSVFERGSYFFGDIYGELTASRTETVKKLAAFQAQQMNRHGVKLLGVVSRHDVDSEKSKMYFEEFIKANDQLEGIIAIQYSPYADGQGRVFWFKNSKGWDIPVVCTRYSVWNTGSSNHAYEGTPKFVADKLKANTGLNKKFSSICVHCWSKFLDKGTSCGSTEENVPNQDAVSWDRPDIVFSAGAAALTMNHLGDNFKAVNTQELVWRLRMDHDPVQTQQILDAM